MTVEERRRRRFSEEFRKEQVNLIESGQLTKAEVSRLYEVKVSNVSGWLEKYGKNPLPERIMVTHSKEYNRVGQLQKENEKLLKIIGSQHVELVYKDKLIKLAKDKLGEAFEKK